MTPTLLNNRYRIIQILGSGGFGETFLAEDSHMPSRRTCVIKQLKPVNKNTQVYQLIQQRFEREAAILETLGEENAQIPRLFAYFAEQEQFYLVQEWIEGLTLAQKLQQEGLLTENLVREILINILPVLDYIHSQGIIHRDIKPSNIIWREQDKKPVLIDFGIAKEIVQTTVDAQGEITKSIVVGTPGFIPPEQAIGKPVYASDIYSLGMTAISLLTGKRPQQLQTNSQTGEIIWRTEASISNGLASILEQAISEHHRERYPTAQAMLTALRSQDKIPEPVTEIPASVTEIINTGDNTSLQLPHSSQNTPITPRIPYSQQEYRNRQILLNKVKNYWVKGVLETSLHGKILIELGLESRLDTLDHPWGIVWENSDKGRQLLPINIRISELFQQLGEGRSLLILGSPGAGKTTTLLELAKDLILAAESDINQPIPVVFNLSAWTNEKLKIADWLVRELNTKYQVSREIGETWIQNQQLLLLLDGLDEVSLERRDACVTAINNFSQAFGQTEIVVCSRIKDYENLSHRLRFQAAVFIQPLNPQQIQQYLNNAGLELAGVSTALQVDSTLQELAKSPLMLSIMTLAYQGISITDLPSMNLEERRQHLFDKYIDRMFERRSVKSIYSKQQSLRWLTWLAQKLKQQSQTVFLIERIQPDWLPYQWQKYIYATSLWVIFVNLSFLLTNALLPVDRAIFLVFTSGILFLFIFGIYQIKPVDNLKWSWEKGITSISQGLVLGAFFGFIGKIITGIIFNPLHWRIFEPQYLNLTLYGWTRGIVFGLSIGLIYGLIKGLTAPSIQTNTIPNQGIWQSGKNAVIFGLIGLALLGASASLLNWLPWFWGVFGCAFGVAAGGGEAFIKHLILRIILYLGGYIPWNYARFLDYAAERIFLQKVGGGYIFVHRLLLEHFVNMQSRS